MPRIPYDQLKQRDTLYFYHVCIESGAHRGESPDYWAARVDLNYDDVKRSNLADREAGEENDYPIPNHPLFEDVLQLVLLLGHYEPYSSRHRARIESEIEAPGFEESFSALSFGEKAELMARSRLNGTRSKPTPCCTLNGKLH